jgi:short-subunit dehydrogenase
LKHSRYDISNREEVVNVPAKIKKEVGIITNLINNASIGTVKKFLDFSKSEIDQVIDIKAHYWVSNIFNISNIINKIINNK